MRNNKMSTIFLFIFVMCNAILLSACHHEQKEKNVEKSNIVIAASDTPIQRLYFSGTLSPINTFAVISPVSGSVVSVNFNYGENVTAGQKLLVLDSKSLSDNYRKAVQDFLQKKQAYIDGKTRFDGNEALYKAGVLAKDTYTSSKTDFENKALDYLQAQYSLEKVLHLAGVDPKKIEALSLSDTKRVNQILETRFQHIDILATHSGIALFPLQHQSSSGGHSSGKIIVGDTIKEGQLLLSIGDLSGLSADFDVSEVDIDRIHKGMPVTVTGSAFPGIELKGYISSVSSQANQNGGSGLSMYAVGIKIPNVTAAEMQKIRVGMTAKFQVDIKLPAHILLPIAAVKNQNGETVVTIVDASGKQKTVPVVTGETTLTHVVIISGIQPGDKVVVP